MSARPIARIAPLAALLFLLGGCVSFGAKAPPMLFDLTAENPAPAGTRQNGTLAGALVVEVPQTPLALSVSRVLVQLDGSSLAYVRNAGWAERPARLFQRLLAEAIRAKGSRLVLESEPGSGASQVLAGRLLAMGFDAQANAAVVRFDAMRSARDGQVQVRRFEARQDASAKPQVLGPALNRAANDVARQVAEWVG